ncbi:hypothetical protein MTO96_018447 [Rhipicephalus appendiculatus]
MKKRPGCARLANSRDTNGCTATEGFPDTAKKLPAPATLGNFTGLGTNDATASKPIASCASVLANRPAQNARYIAAKKATHMRGLHARKTDGIRSRYAADCARLLAIKRDAHDSRRSARHEPFVVVLTPTTP